MLPGNSQAEPRLAAAVLLVENRKHLVAASFRLVEDAAVGGGIGQPVLPPEAVVCRFACCRRFFRWMPDRRVNQCFGDSRTRPLARRRFNTWRPAFVAIRARKPCVRARFRLLGWNVRFMLLRPVYCCAVCGAGKSPGGPPLPRKKAGKGTREA